jgi:hypothetical protein
MAEEPVSEGSGRPSPASTQERSKVLHALAFSAVIQGILMVFAGMVLDTGALRRLVGISMVFFWASVLGVALVRTVKRRSASGFDVALLKYGFLGFLALMPFLNSLAYFVKNRLGLLQ